MNRVSLFAAGVIMTSSLNASSATMITLKGDATIVDLRIMVRTGSAHDPKGKEGLASLTAQTLVEGGFGDSKNPITKERLSEITLPWGSRAYPSIRTDKETTTFVASIPKEAFATYIDEIIRPMFTKPLFMQTELDRLRNEQIPSLASALRYESVEQLGLETIDNYIFEGTSYGHSVAGSVQGLKSISQKDLLDFFRNHYTPSAMIIGLGTSDTHLVAKLASVFPSSKSNSRVDSGASASPKPVANRELIIVSVPKLASTGLHAGFPLPLTRKDKDFWPLYVANVFFGTHRDSFSHLYEEIREKRGYNYGDYSYIEHFEGRPYNFFPPFNTPRHHQYFSIWIRPVSPEFTHHILKAFTWELDNFAKNGLTNEQVEAAKNKARILYLSLAEDRTRLLSAKMDDAYYGMTPGYLDGYLKRIDAVTPDSVNKAIHTYLQSQRVKFVVVTGADNATTLANDIQEGKNAKGKHINERDTAWEAYPMGFSKNHIRVIPVEKLFETSEFIAK